jgi:hypothetical protein
MLLLGVGRVFIRRLRTLPADTVSNLEFWHPESLKRSARHTLKGVIYASVWARELNQAWIGIFELVETRIRYCAGGLNFLARNTALRGTK